MSDLLKRLEIIQNAVALGDEDIIASQAKKLPDAAAELRRFLENKEYAAAAVWIGDFRKNNFSPVEYQDPEIAALQMELKTLENTLTELAAEKSECESVIAEFNAAYLEEVGDLLEKVLRAEMAAAEKQTGQNAAKEIENARKEYQEFRKQREQTPKPSHLSEDEKTELKKLFKRAAFKCHPDRFPNDSEKAKQGGEIFKELEEANRKQDINRIREIWQKLQDGDWTTGSAAVMDKDILRRQISALRQKTEILRAEIGEVCEGETWRLIQALAAEKTPWADYFAQTRGELRQKLGDGEDGVIFPPPRQHRPAAVFGIPPPEFSVLQKTW